MGSERTNRQVEDQEADAVHWERPRDYEGLGADMPLYRSTSTVYRPRTTPKDEEADVSCALGTDIYDQLLYNGVDRRTEIKNALGRRSYGR